MVAPKAKPYGLDPAFERTVAVLCAARPKFWGRIGKELDPELLSDATAKHSMLATRAVALELGRGPSSTVVVVQRMRRWMQDGKFTFEQVRDVADMMDEAEDRGLPREEDITAELTPILQRHIRDRAVHEAIEGFGKAGDLNKVVQLEQKAQRIGQTDTSIGTILGPASFEEMRTLRHLERLSTGIPELDTIVSGGLQRSGLGVVLGASGDGKSMFLSHQAAIGAASGLFVAYATLELPKPIILARIKANLTNITIDELLEEQKEELAIERLTEILDKSGGQIVVQEFTPQATTIEDIREWIETTELEMGRTVDMLVVDYGDKMVSSTSKREEKNSYTSSRDVFEGLRVYAVEHKMFCWTASQANRQKDRKKRLDLNDTADSLHKVRVADLVITLNLKNEGSEIVFYAAKNRTGKAHGEAGPLPVDFATGRIAPIQHEAYII